jgi:hypothetical protein
MPPKRSTLLTSPVSFADFVCRVVFFSLAPFAIVVVAQLFPVGGALLDVGLALLVFIFSEGIARLARSFRPIDLLVSATLAFESYYGERPPRPFAYYVFYPLLFPYWLWHREARREFLVFRSYTLAGLGLLLASLGWQYHRDWAPGLGLTDYLPFVLLSLVVETLLVLALLMPIATTVVWYHSSFRRGRLAILLVIGLFSTAFALGYVALRREPVVSYATRERVRLRTARSPDAAHAALLHAASAGLQASHGEFDVDADGIVEGPALGAAQADLEAFYKHDESYAFNLWASPPGAAQLLVLYFEARPHRRPIWIALRRDGSEVRSARELPRGAFRAMRDAEGPDAELWTWPDQVGDGLSLGEDRGPGGTRSRHGRAPSTSPTP